jgi:hypothetical protein
LVGLGGMFAGMIGTGGPAAAEGNCENLTLYTALASAVGGHTVAAAPGVTLVAEVDAGLPAAQALLDSVQGSKGFAGSPYSAAVADNAGAGGADSGQIPVFAISSHPAQPKGAQTFGAGTLSSESSADATTSSAKVGAPPTPAGASGSSDLAAKAECAGDTTLTTTADSVVSGIDIGGVLKIGAVRSHAKAIMTPDGERKLEGSVEITGASVGGQGVSITDKGVVLAGTPTALPTDPITPALKAAGITVRYVAAEQNREEGQILAPTLEVTVAQKIGDVPGTVTYTFGRALARVAAEAGDGALAAEDVSAMEDFSSFDSGSTFSDTVSADVAPLPEASGGTGSTATPSGGSGEASLPTARIADWSIAPGYSAMGVGALLLLVAWVGLEKIAVRFRWR